MNCYFLGGMTSEGFKTDFNETIYSEDKFTYILKGGPGTGKSTIMKKVAETFSDTDDIDLYYCSSDEKSLDAVVLNKKGIIVVDGTSPHIFDPIYPGIKQTIIHLGDFWNTETLKKNEENIILTTKENSEWHKRCRRYITALSSINSDIYSIGLSALDKNKLFLVEHDIKDPIEQGTWNDNIITLREMDYKNANPIAINPHYFGEIKITPKNKDIINFLTVGVIKPRKKNNSTIINAVMDLHNKGITNFKVTVVGKGHIKDIPKEIQKYFDIKGRLPFNKMYDEIEKADFLITAYDSDNPRHLRYITTGTSGNFQLIYGFTKPCLINKKYAPLNEFNEENSILYENPEDYSKAMEYAMNMTQEEYSSMQDNLKITTEKIYKKSLENTKKLLQRGNS